MEESGGPSIKPWGIPTDMWRGCKRWMFKFTHFTLSWCVQTECKAKFRLVLLDRGIIYVKKFHSLSVWTHDWRGNWKTKLTSDQSPQYYQIYLLRWNVDFFRRSNNIANVAESCMKYKAPITGSITKHTAADRSANFSKKQTAAEMLAATKSRSHSFPALHFFCPLMTCLRSHRSPGRKSQWHWIPVINLANSHGCIKRIQLAVVW